MSVFGNLLNGVFGGDGEGSEPKPCKNCPSTCGLFPDACGECASYKEKLIDLLYDAAHLEEYYDRYEIVPALGQAAGTVTCPACGAPNPANAAACEFCGTQLRESSGKIEVSSAKEIPDPIQLAQDVIFERQEIVRKYEREKSGFLENLTELVTGGEAPFGERMSTDELQTTAAEYGVSVADYLQGLDNGKYLTASAKKKQDEAAAAKAAAQAAAASAAYGRPAQSAHYRPAQQHRHRQERPAAPPPPPHRRQERPAAPPMQHSRPDAFRQEAYPSFGSDNRPDFDGRPGSGGSMGHGRPAPGFNGRPGPGGRTGGPAPGSKRLPGEKAGPGSRAKPDSGPAGKVPNKPASGNKGGKSGGKSGKGGR